MTLACRCPDCWGFAEYMLKLTGKDYGLPFAPGHRSVAEIQAEHPMTCECLGCAGERGELQRLARTRKIKQPWDLAA